MPPESNATREPSTDGTAVDVTVTDTTSTDQSVSATVSADSSVVVEETMTLSSGESAVVAAGVRRRGRPN
ncbi:hypothetical protein [Haloarcula sp. JP-L23]|uniref:hypothetical protein n=1 Tax=Haloarcula sp. JP-L23 TaxID=2716717 RepID=UPI00140F3F91|nr:hypothetical protein G9465_10685 [Haloarcula sp. JP-L23]